MGTATVPVELTAVAGGTAGALMTQINPSHHRWSMLIGREPTPGAAHPAVRRRADLLLQLAERARRCVARIIMRLG